MVSKETRDLGKNKSKVLCLRQRIPSKSVFYYRCPDHGNNYVLSFAFAFDREGDIYYVSKKHFAAQPNYYLHRLTVSAVLLLLSVHLLKTSAVSGEGGCSQSSLLEERAPQSECGGSTTSIPHSLLTFFSLSLTHGDFLATAKTGCCHHQLPTQLADRLSPENGVHHGQSSPRGNPCLLRLSGYSIQFCAHR